jgi:hypothetical protein
VTNSLSRRAIGLAAAVAVLVAIGAYCTWRMEIVSRRGWMGFSYVPPVGRAGTNTAMIGLQPGSVFMVFPGSPAEHAGIQRGDIIVAIDGIAASEMSKLLPVGQAAKRGDVVRYRISRNGQSLDVQGRLASPLADPMFAVTFATSIVVALTFLVIGAFVFWRRPADARATVFYAMTLVAAVTFASTSLIQVDSANMRGIAVAQSLGDVWRLIFLGAAGLFFAPLLLHLALIFPKERPIVQRRRAIFQWIYGYPTLLLCYGGIFLAFVTALESRRGVLAKAVIGTMGVLAVAALANIVISIVRRGIREGLLSAPLGLIAIAVSLYAGVLLLAGRLTTHTKSVMPLFSATLLLVVIGILSFSSYAIATFVALFRSYRESGPEERRQVKWPIWATIVAVIGKVVLGLIGFAIVFLTTFRASALITAVYILPDIAAKLLYVLIPISFAFAILKYRLMNIDVIIRRTVLYSLFTCIVFALYGVVVISVGTALVKFAGLTSQTMLIASTVVIAVAAVPIRNRLQGMVDRNLFREKRDYPLALRNIGNAIGGSAVEDFLRYCAEQIQQAMQNRMVVIAVRRDREFVAAAKVGVADEILGRVRVPVDADLTTVPEPLRKIGASLIVPVRTHRDVLAILAVGAKLSDEEFRPEDVEFLNSVAPQIAVGIENVRLRDEEVDFEQARAMQQILLPTRFPQLEGFEITGMWQPARSVGGDYFDTLALGGGKAAICIGDVAGKGMPAALLMANLQAAVKATAAASVEPAVVCERVKEIVGGNLVGGKFISFFYGVVDAAARTFAYSNAGHNPPILVRADMTVERLARGGPAMCRLFKDVPQEQDVARLGPGDRIVLFTDGVSEARQGEEDFGDDRLIQLLLAHRHLGARELQDRIVDAIRDFTGGDFNDDVTLVVIAAR